MRYTASSGRQYRKAGSWNHQTYRGTSAHRRQKRYPVDGAYRGQMPPAENFDEATRDMYREAMEREVLPPRYKDRKETITFVETKEYTADGAWAHIHPWQRIMCIQPPELRDYRLPIFEHEGLHAVYRGTEPDRDMHESFVTSYAHNPSSRNELYNRIRFVKR